MSSDLEKIALFISKHHVMSLATAYCESISVCSLFYIHDTESFSFVVASSEDTLHVKHVIQNSAVAGNILLETDTVGKIEGLQFQGTMTPLKDKYLQKLYFKSYPYALAMMPKLWQIRVSSYKLTDNRLGFGKKIIYLVS